jgi:hypothetical protein
VKLTVVAATKGYCELVTDPATERPRLEKPKMMGIGRRSAAHQAGLPGHEFPMLLIAQASGSTSRSSSTPTPRSLAHRVIPFFDSHDVKLLRVLTDRGSEYCGNPERHEYELYLAVEDIDHSAPKPRARRPTASASASTKPC